MKSRKRTVILISSVIGLLILTIWLIIRIITGLCTLDNSSGDSKYRIFVLVGNEWKEIPNVKSIFHVSSRNAVVTLNNDDEINLNSEDFIITDSDKDLSELLKTSN